MRIDLRLRQDPLELAFVMPRSNNQPFDSVDDVLADIAMGKMVMVTDAVSCTHLTLPTNREV